MHPALTYRPVTIVNASAIKQLKLRIEVPVEDMARLGAVEEIPSGPASQAPRRVSIWNAIHPRLLELIRERNSTILFVNSRQVAERLAGALNELAGEPIVRAHHGSLAAAQRSVIEEQLKAGQIKGLCATSTLELGIDMGAVDLVIQIEAPPSVASGMQRIGRAGHSVDAVSEGVLFPKYRADLVACAAVTRAMHEGHIESTRYPRNPLDVLAQQIVAIVAQPPGKIGTREPGNREPGDDAKRNPEVSVDALYDLVRRAAPFGELTRSTFEGILDLLSGRYPSDEFAELRPRLTWDRVRNVVTAREGAGRLAILNAGTIPDRGLYGVFLAHTEGKSVRVGELDEEMVFESHTNETFILGASTWRIVDITHDRVLVEPAPGEPGKMPFWKGDGPGRPLEFGRRIGALVRELRDMPKPAAMTRLVAEHDLDPGRGRQPAPVPGRPGGGDRRGPRRPHDRHRAQPRRAGRLARVRADSVRQPHSHSVGHGGGSPHSSRGRTGRGDTLGRRWICAALSRYGCAAGFGLVPGGVGRSHGPGAAPAWLDGAVRRAVSARRRGGRCCCRAAVPMRARRCGSCASGPTICSMWLRGIPRFRCCWRLTASACATCSTCRRCWRPCAPSNSASFACTWWRRASPRRLRRRCCSATWPILFTTAMRRWPSGGPRR